MIKPIKIGFVMLLLSIIVVWILIWSGGVSPKINDSQEYLNCANNMVQKHVFYAGDLDEALDFRLFSKRTIGYPLHLIFQYSSVALMTITSGGFLLLSFFLGLAILELITQKSLAYKIYVFLFLFNVSALFHVSFILADLALMALVTLGVYVAMIRNIAVVRKINLIAFLWCLGVLLKPVLLPSLVVWPLVFFYYRYRKGKWLPVVLVPVFVVLMVGARNHQKTSQFEYSSISTINLGRYNAKLLIAHIHGYKAAQNYVSHPIFAIPTNKREYKKYASGVKSMAIQTISKDWVGYIKVHSLGVFKMVLDPGRFELFSIQNKSPLEVSLTEVLLAKDWIKLKSYIFEHPAVWVLFLGLFFLSVLKVILFFFSTKQVLNNPAILVVLLYFIGIAGPVGAARFLLPVGVLFLVCCSLGGLRILDFFQKSSKC